MIQLDLLPEEFRTEEKSSFRMTDLASPKSILICLGLCMIGSVLIFVFNILVVAPRYNAVQDLHFQHAPAIAQMQALKAEISSLQDRERKLQAGMTRPFFWTEIMNGLAESLVKGIWLNQTQVKKIKIGMAPPPADSMTGREVPIFANILVINGDVISGDDPTATVSQFTSKLIQNKSMNSVFGEIFVKDIKKKTEKNNIYSFEIHAVFSESNASIFEAFVA